MKVLDRSTGREEEVAEAYKLVVQYTTESLTGGRANTKAELLQQAVRRHPALQAKIASGELPPVPKIVLSKEAGRQVANSKKRKEVAAAEKVVAEAKRAKTTQAPQAEHDEKVQRLHAYLNKFDDEYVVPKEELYEMGATAMTEMNALFNAGENLELANDYQHFIRLVMEQKVVSKWTHSGAESTLCCTTSTFSCCKYHR